MAINLKKRKMNFRVEWAAKTRSKHGSTYTGKKGKGRAAGFIQRSEAKRLARALTENGFAGVCVSIAPVMPWHTPLASADKIIQSITRA